jgi:hypothetical protein
LAQSKTGKKVVEFTLAVGIKRLREQEAAAKTLPAGPGQKPVLATAAATVK